MLFSRRLLARITAPVLVLALSACAAYPQGPQNYPSYPANNYPANNYPVSNYPSNGYPAGAYPSYPAQGAGNYPVQGQGQAGRVANIERLAWQGSSSGIGGSGIGAGAVVGGVLGGVLGRQVGKGNGRDLATLAGVVGGALAGNVVDDKRDQGQPREMYRVTVQMERGGAQSFDYPQPPALRVGDWVRVHNGQIVR